VRIPNQALLEVSGVKQAAGVFSGEVTQRVQGHPQEEGRLGTVADEDQNPEGINRGE
jgi:hypothetical protein